MKLSESFGLLSGSTLGDADSKYDRYCPRLHQDGSIAYSAIDGTPIESATVREVAQWVSTLEDNDDLTYALLSVGKRRLRTIGTKMTMHVTDARVVFIQNKVKSANERVVGHIRYPWVDAIVWQQRFSKSKRPKLQIWMHEDFPVKHLGSWHHYIELEFDDSVDATAIALNLARRVSAHNLAHGAPAWIHDRLREQSQLTQLPQPDEMGEGLWESPASVACPLGAEYIDDSPPPAEWIGRGAQAPAAEPVAESAAPEELAPSFVFLKRMIARGKSIARERGHRVVGADDLLLALLIDSETPVGQLMERHGANYDSVKLQIDAGQPRFDPPPDQPRSLQQVKVGKQKLRFTIALRLMNTMRDIGSSEDAGDHEGALGHGQRLVELAQKSGISTMRAFAQVQVGTSYLALGRLNEAHNTFAAAATLRFAPTVTWSALAEKIDPIEIVDDALYGVWEVAEKRNDTEKSAEISALEHLREFRTQYGSDETAAWTAERLAHIHSKIDDFAAAARWGEIASEEYGRAGNAEDAARVSRDVAESHRQSGNPDRALIAAERAVEGAVAAGDKHLEVSARFERARTNRTLGSTPAALDELLLLLPDARQRNPSMARAIVIQIAEIDVAVGATHAIALAEADVVFNGPRAAEITLSAARSLLTDDVDEARRLLIHSVRFVVGVLTHPDTIKENIDRAFKTLGDTLTASDDPELTQQAVQMLVGPLRHLAPQRLGRQECLDFLKALDAAERYDALAALAAPIVDRLAEAVADHPDPDNQDLVALVRRQWELIRGLQSSNQEEAALAVYEDLIGWMRKAADNSSSERSRLGFYLACYGSDLMELKRYADAHDKQTEGISLLRSAMSEGKDCAHVLALAIRGHAKLAALTEDHAAHRSRLQDAMKVVDSAGNADWVAETRAKIRADLTQSDTDRA